MKKLLQQTLLIVGAAFSAVKAGDAHRSFFTVRQHYLSASPERVSLFRNDLSTFDMEDRSAFQVVGYGSSSTTAHYLSKYFMPPTCNDNIQDAKSCCFIVSEFNDTSTLTDGFRGNDVEARHLNIQTNTGTFRSRVCFEPKQRVVGVGFTFRRYLNEKCDDNYLYWFELSSAVERVTNRMNLREQVLDNGGGVAPVIGLDNSLRVGNVTSAFKQNNWNFGRIDDCRCESRTGLADVEIKFGWIGIQAECCQYSSYIGVVAPTGNRVRNHKVFEPMVGNNHHFGVISGTALHFEFGELACGGALSWKLDTDARYLFPNHQIRSLDVVGKPWSRYMETYRNQDEAIAAFRLIPTNNTEASNLGTSGINVFTRCVRVSPHAAFTGNTALFYTNECGCGNIIGELGLNFYARQAERIELECAGGGEFTPALKAVNGLGQTTYARTIRDNFVNSNIAPTSTAFTYGSLRGCDLDVESAAHPAIFSSIAYAAIGFKAQDCPAIAGIGGSYEFASVNTSLQRWTIWGKFAYAF